MTLELIQSIKQNLLERKLLKFINSSDNNCTYSCITHESWCLWNNFRFVNFHERNNHLGCSLFAFTLMNRLSELSIDLIWWVCWSLSSESISEQSFPFSFFSRIFFCLKSLQFLYFFFHLESNLIFKLENVNPFIKAYHLFISIFLLFLTCG